MLKPKDLKADNFLLGFEESSVIKDYVRRLKATWNYSADIWNLGMVVRTSGFEIAIRAIPLTLTPWKSCGSFYKTLHSSMGLGLKATSTPAKPISLG